jgi:peptide alpha-N-acetyltransferase
MASVYKAAYVSLHVRKSNIAAIGLYRDTLGFEVAQVVKKYCQYSHIFVKGYLLTNTIPCVDGDGEDALSMRLSLETV